MSNYLQKDNYSFLSSRTSNGIKHYGFQDTKTEPETVYSLLRELLSESTPNVRRRAFQMYMMLTRNTSSKMDITGSLVVDYSIAIRGIFKPFINGYGKFNNNVNYRKELDNLRIVLSRHIKRITGCGDVNIILKSPTASFIDEKITCYINDGVVVDGDTFEYGGDNTGIKLPKTSTVTVCIPVKYIKSVVSKAYHHCTSEFTKNGIKLESMDPRLVSAMMERISITESRTLFKALCAALYKEQIFLTFARDVSITASNVIKHKTGREIKFSTHYKSKDSVSSLNFKLIEDLIYNENITQINPHLFLDLFEITDKEINTFIENFVRDDMDSSIYAPEYTNLHLTQNSYIDEESEIAASLAYTIKLNYCIMALMITTKNSIKESTRSKYVDMIKGTLSSVKSRSKMSYVTDNKSTMIEEINRQLSMIDRLANDIIKLKRYVERDR